MQDNEKKINKFNEGQTEKKENMDILDRARVSFAATHEIPDSTNESNEYSQQDNDNELNQKEYLESILKDVSTLKKQIKRKS